MLTRKNSERVMILLIAVVLFLQMAADAESKVVEETMAVVGVTATAISPDGQTVLYITSQADVANNAYITKLTAVKKNGQDTRTIFADGKTYVADPQWSPSGKYFAVQANGLLSVFSAETLKKVKEIAGEEELLLYRWGKDDNTIWIVSKVNKTLTNAPQECGQFGGINKVWLYDWQNNSKQLMAEEKEGSIVDICRSYNGDKLVYTHQANDIYNNAGDRIVAVDAVTKGCKELGNGEKLSVLSLAGCLADDKAVFAGLRKYPYYAFSDRPAIMTADINSGKISRLLFPQGSSAAGLELKIYNNGKNIIGRVAEGADTLLFNYGNGMLLQETVLPKHIAHLSISETGRISYVKQDFHEPAEVFLADVGVLFQPEYKPVAVSSVNKKEEQLYLPRVELIKWQSSNKREIQGMLVYPTDYREGQNYPLLTIVLGGTAPVIRSYVGTMDLLACGICLPFPVRVFAERGYMVLWANCQSYDTDDINANVSEEEILTEVYCDSVMSGVDELVKKGLADGKRLGLLGWSMGGFIAARLATLPENNFKVLVSGGGIYNWTSMFANSNCFEYEKIFGGGFWQSDAILNRYLQNSPIINLGKMKAATLILHGMDDQIVPVAQGRELYYSLRLAGKKVKLMEYPHTGHMITDVSFTLQAADETIKWIDIN